MYRVLAFEYHMFNISLRDKSCSQFSFVEPFGANISNVESYFLCHSYSLIASRTVHVLIYSY